MSDRSLTKRIGGKTEPLHIALMERVGGKTEPPQIALDGTVLLGRGLIMASDDRIDN